MTRPLPYRWVVAWTLAITETISWGILYYAFGVLIAPMERELGWTRAQSTAAFSIALLVSAAGAIPAGRWVDRGGARTMMTLGSVTACLLLLAWAHVQSLIALYLTWAAIGVTMAAVLYEPAFAVLAKWFSRDRDRAFTLLTLLGGLASTIFNPLTNWLAGALGWRGAVLALAGILAATTIPMHALLLRGRPDEEPPPPRATPDGVIPATPADVEARVAVRTATFWFLAVAFVIQSFAHVSVSVHAVPMLIEWGYTPAFAATTVGLVGAMQVGGRLVFWPLRARLSTRTVTMLVFALQSVALVILRTVAGVTGVLGFVICFGMGNGMTTLIRASLIAELFGRAHYGAIAGTLALWATLARAVAPVAIGLLYGVLGGYPPILVMLAAASAVAVLAAGRALRPSLPPPDPRPASV